MQPVEINDSDELFRRIVPGNISPDGTLNPGAFSLREGEDYLSVDLARLTTPEDCLARSGRTDVGLVVITAGAVRARNLDVVSDPVAADPISETPGTIAHARIVGPNDRSTRRYLVSQSVILVYPRDA